MTDIKWTNLLGWSKEQLDDLRFVAFSYIKQGHYETSLKIFEALITLDPNNAYDLQSTGALYLQLGNNLEALHFLDRSLKLEPRHYHSLLNRAKALFMLGYTQQGTAQTLQLEKCKDPEIAKQASALLMTFH